MVLEPTTLAMDARALALPMTQNAPIRAVQQSQLGREGEGEGELEAAVRRNEVDISGVRAEWIWMNGYG